MEKRRKKFLWVAGAFLSPFILLILISFLLPFLVNLQPIKNRIQNDLAQKIGGKLSSEEIILTLIPTPRISFRQLRVSFGERLTARVDRLTAHPRLLPLLKGEIQLASLRLDTPDLKAQLPRQPGKTERTENKVDNTSVLQKNLQSMLNKVTSLAPGLSVRIENGKLQLSRNEMALFQFHHIKGRLHLPPEHFEFALSCQSNLWKSVSVRVELDDNLAVNGMIHVDELQPQLAADYLFPSSSLKVVDAKVNLDARFSSANLDNLNLDLQGSAPSLTLSRGKSKVTVKCSSVKGAVHWSRSKTTVELQELLLDAPQLSLSGRFSKETEDSGGYALDIKGTDINVDSTRKAALELLGQYPVTRKIFEIVTGGTVPVITFSTHGKTPHDLGSSENIHITGTMKNGNIFVPKADLDLTEVYGDVDITGGILKGEKLRAKLEHSRATGGSLLIGLSGKDVPFHLDLTVDADLSQLPPILHRVVHNKRFTGEIERIESFKGHAQGRFVLGESIDSIKALVEVRNLQLTASYKRIPYPLQVRSGQFFYDGTKEVVSVKNLSGNLGNSSFQDFTGEIVWLNEMQLQVQSQNATLSVSEIYPWLVSYPKLASRLKEFKLGKGTITFSEANLKGPLLKPKKWQFKATGSLKDLTFEWKPFPGPLFISKGSFEGLPHMLKLNDTKASMLDASFTASARLHDFLRGFSGADLAIAGTLGHEAIDWIARLSNLPSQFNFRPPLEVTRGRLKWERNSETSFSGELLPKGGPKVTLDQVWQKDRLLIKKLLIEDEESNASISLDLRPRDFDLTFSGKLTKNTADELLEKNQILSGWVSGDFSAHISLEKYLVSTAQGELEGQGLHFPQLRELDEVKYFSVEAATEKLIVRSATVVWADNQFAVSGTIGFSINGFLLDLEASVDGIEWTDVERIMNVVKEGAGKSEQLKRLGILGDIKIRSNFFGFDNYSWHPFEADVNFSPSGIEVLITKARLCDISTTGMVRTSPDSLKMKIQARALKRQLNPTLSCLWDKSELMKGSYTFDADLSAHLLQDQFLGSLQGKFTFDAENGRIYRFGLLENVFSVLNFTEIFRGKLPDLEQEGFGYESFQMNGTLQDGKIDIEEAIIKGSSMELVGRGIVDMLNKKIDLTLLVAPLKTLDVIISYIPLVNGILGNIVSIPVQVTGDMANPTVIPLSPSAVGSDLLGIMKKTLELPMRIIQPLLPEETPAQQAGQNSKDPQ